MTDPSPLTGSLVSHRLTTDVDGRPLGVEETVHARGVTLTARPRPADECFVEYEPAPDATYPPLPEED